MSLWIRKPMSSLRAEAGESGAGALKRSLGAMNLTLLGIGAIIGAGIFKRGSTRITRFTWRSTRPDLG